MYIAHYSKIGKRLQSVKEHLNNVSEFSEDFGESIGIPNLSRLVGLLHDMGKLSDEFQEYIKTAIALEESGALDEMKNSLKTVDHGRIGGMYIYNKYHDMKGYAKLAAEIISMVVCYHHGGLHDFITFDCETPLLKRIQLDANDYSYKQACERFFEQVCSEETIDSLFQKACMEIEIIDKKLIENNLLRSFSIHLLIKQLYSILIDADRYDTYLFMENIKVKPSVDTQTLWKQYSDLMNIKISKFKKMKTNSPFEERIKQLRLEISEACADFYNRKAGIYTLTVPTGGGKTLSSLRFALKHADAKGKKRIIYVLPFTTIIEQNAQEVRDVLKCDDYLLEHHSNIDYTHNDDSDDIYRILTQRWDSPIIFTTMVQFLNTIYAGGTQHIRRLHNLSNSILIFDEIQAIPIRCITLFNCAVNYLSRICNSTVVLCSATQPNLSETKTPLIKDSDGEIIPDMVEKFSAFKRMEVIDRRIDGGYTYAALADFIDELTGCLSSILVILNTKKCAESTYKELKSRNKEKKYFIFYLSTNLCPAHRKKVIRVIKKCLKRKKPVICVSTQLIEAGVDISFEGVIRHLAGLDSIAQAAGRGNRHGEDVVRQAYIINLKDEELGSLKEIELGEKHTLETLNDIAKKPEKFNNDLLSPMAIKRYYSYYYGDSSINDLMNFPVTIKENNVKCETEIYKMLAGSIPNRISFRDKFGRECNLHLNFMFETAGRYFKVIDDLTTSILVPYGKGKEIIADLFSSISFKDKLKNLKLVQQYSINIYDNQFRTLKNENALILSEISGVYILKDGYYDKKMGLITDKQMDFLSV